MCSTQDTSKIIRTTFHKIVYGKKRYGNYIKHKYMPYPCNPMQCHSTILSLAFENEILFSSEVRCSIKEAIVLSAWEFETKEVIFEFTFSHSSTFLPVKSSKLKLLKMRELWWRIVEKKKKFSQKLKNNGEHQLIKNGEYLTTLLIKFIFRLFTQINYFSSFYHTNP